MKKSLIIIITAIVVGIIGAGFFVFYKQPIQTPPENAKITENVQDPETKILTEEEISQMTIEELGAKIAESEQQIKDLEYQQQLQESIKNNPLPEKSFNSMPMHATEDERIEGITITIQGNTKLVVNNAQGYSIEVPSKLVMARTLNNSMVQIFDPETMCLHEGCPADIGIYVYQGERKEFHKQRLEHLLNEEKIKFETVIVDGEKSSYFFSEANQNNPNTYNYDLEKGDKLYSISISDDPLWQDAINSFKFLTTQP